MKHSSHINKTEVLAASAAGNIATEIIKDIGKSVFGIKSDLEKDVNKIENEVNEIKKNTEKILDESLRLKPTGRKEEVLTLRSSKKVMLVEFHVNKGDVFYELESVTDSNYFPPC